MAQTMMKGAFHNEKTDVLGELAIRLKNTNVRGILMYNFSFYQSKLVIDWSMLMEFQITLGGSDTKYPPPPPVFQTYAKQLSGDSRDHETTSEPRPQIKTSGEESPVLSSSLNNFSL